MQMHHEGDAPLMVRQRAARLKRVGQMDACALDHVNEVGNHPVYPQADCAGVCQDTTWKVYHVQRMLFTILTDLGSYLSVSLAVSEQFTWATYDEYT